MANKVLKTVTLIILSLIVVVALVNLVNIVFFDDDSGMTTSSASSTLAIMYILLFTGLLSNKRRSFVTRKIIAKNKAPVFYSFEEYLGKSVIVETLTSEIHGTLVEVEGDWIKVKDHDMRHLEHILRSTMVISIKIK